MKIPQNTEEAKRILQQGAVAAGDYLDGTDNGTFDGREFVKRLHNNASHDWPATIITCALSVAGWEFMHRWGFSLIGRLFKAVF